jgi:hypothetical protein
MSPLSRTIDQKPAISAKTYAKTSIKPALSVADWIVGELDKEQNFLPRQAVGREGKKTATDFRIRSAKNVSFRLGLHKGRCDGTQ